MSIVDELMQNASSSNLSYLEKCMRDANQRATNFDDLWHPYIVLYIGHCLAAVVGVLLSYKAPCCYAIVMVLSGIPFIYSLATGAGMWNHLPGSFLWIGVFTKWLIVNIGATIPVLLLRARKCSRTAIQSTAIGIYVILGANIIWTLGHDSQGHVIVYINRIAGVALVIALFAHCLAICCRGQKDLDRQGVRTGAAPARFGTIGKTPRRSPLLFEVARDSCSGDPFPYGFGTTLPWLVCYTVWNALFIAKITIGGLLQDILFWCLMVAYQYFDQDADGYKLPIELYFGYARPVQLGTYIAFTEFVGTFFPYFYEAPELIEEQPLPVNSHAFFLFIAFMNMLWSFVVVFWSFMRLFSGLGYFTRHYKEVYRRQAEDPDSESEELSESEE